VKNTQLYQHNMAAITFPPRHQPDQGLLAMRTLDEMIGQLRKIQPDLRRRYPIREIGVFGSYVRGEQTEGNDLDILVNLGEGIGLIELAGLQQDLSDALGVRVDLAIKDTFKRRIGRQILLEAVML
jgi:hypothetical protein